MMRQAGAGLRDNSNSFSLHSCLGFCLCVTHSLTLVCTTGAIATRASGFDPGSRSPIFYTVVLMAL